MARTRFSLSVLAVLALISLLGPISVTPGAYAETGGVWRIYTQANQVRDLAVEGDYVWAATTGGAIRWDRTEHSYVKYTTLNGLSENGVLAVAVAGSGDKWFGTGLLTASQFDGTNWTTYTTADGLAAAAVRAIAVDGAGHVWFATSTAGVSEFDGATWTTYTAAPNGLASDTVFDVAVDGEDNEWFATGAGVSMFDGDDWTTYTTGDGLAD
ncbi:MAG: hypothetical protein ACK2UU_16640, partial [Anaerolineae bacterium]